MVAAAVRKQAQYSADYSKVNAMAIDSIGSRITHIFSAMTPLSREEGDALVSSWTESRSLRRNDFLIRKGEVEDRLFYVIAGSMRIYYPHGDEQICVGFAHDENLICSYPSFILSEPSDYYIQALGKTEVISIRRSDFYELFDRFPKIERAWRQIGERALLGKIQREVEMLTFTPEERYKRLILRSPHLFQKIPRKYIASYLRMTPETLSRIRPA